MESETLNTLNKLYIFNQTLVVICVKTVLRVRFESVKPLLFISRKKPT